ncbi:MAG: radical SAM protein [Candidatus Omnitrophota bacterium]
MNARVMILFPNTSNDGVIPLAVGILSTIAKNAGCQVHYFESTFYNKRNTATEDHEIAGEFQCVKDRKKSDYPPMKQFYLDFRNALFSFRPQILAVHVNSLEWELFKEIMANVSFPDPAPFVIAGGVHASIDPESVISEPFIDAVCVGEGEDVWADFIAAINSNGSIVDLHGLWVRTPEGIRKNPKRSLIKAVHLWDIPVDYSFFDDRHLLKPYDGQMRRRGLIEYSRGCPFNCYYCVNSALKEKFRGLGKFFRVRPFKNFQQGVYRLKSMGAEILQLQDECFLFNNIADIKRFCDWYGEEIRLPLLLQTRPESVTVENISLIAKMRIPVQITLGVESGSPRILGDICNRHMSIDIIKNAFEVIHHYGLRSSAYCMIGFPTETRQEVFQTIRLIRHVQPTIAIMSVFYPFPGVPLRKFCVDRGFIKGDELARTFTDDTILVRQPMSPREIKNIRRCFRIYTKLPVKYLSHVERCERDFENNRELFAKLVKLSWSNEALDYQNKENICLSI